MEIPYVRGRAAAQAHVGIHKGTVEGEYARQGFSGRCAHLYRCNAPVGWTRIEGPLRPHAYDLRDVGSRAGGDWLAARLPLLASDDVRRSFGAIDAPMPYFIRNADELLFVHEGAGRLETDFGPLAWETGDYLVVLRGTMYRLTPTSGTRLLLVETRGELRLPDRGLLGQHALFDPALLRVPSPEEGASLLPNEDYEWELRVQREGEITRVFYPFDPLDVVGWKGTLAPRQLNLRDIQPVLSDRYPLPPSAHATFVTEGVVVRTFVPRPLENGGRRALTVPFHHSNVDYDEVLVYHRGTFFGRVGVGAGMLTFHPPRHPTRAAAWRREPRQGHGSHGRGRRDGGHAGAAARERAGRHRRSSGLLAKLARALIRPSPLQPIRGPKIAGSIRPARRAHSRLRSHVTAPTPRRETPTPRSSATRAAVPRAPSGSSAPRRSPPRGSPACRAARAALAHGGTPCMNPTPPDSAASTSFSLSRPIPIPSIASS